MPQRGTHPHPGETAYFVPNPYDLLMSGGGPLTDPQPRDRWYADQEWIMPTTPLPTRWRFQTDWFFHSLLRELQPDPLGFFP